MQTLRLSSQIQKIISCGPARAGWLVALLLLTLPAQVRAETLEQIIALPEAPPGVVIETIEDSEEDFAAILPALNQTIRQIRQRFPALPIAVVSHGREQFALTRANRETYTDAHEQVQSLVTEEVTLHVCGTHAAWHGVTPEDFPAYVDVAASGPAQINDYINLGYLLLQL